MAVGFKAGSYWQWSRSRYWSHKTAFDIVKIENRSLFKSQLQSDRRLSLKQSSMRSRHTKGLERKGGNT